MTFQHWQTKTTITFHSRFSSDIASTNVLLPLCLYFTTIRKRSFVVFMSCDQCIFIMNTSKDKKIHQEYEVNKSDLPRVCEIKNRLNLTSAGTVEQSWTSVPRKLRVTVFTSKICTNVRISISPGCTPQILYNFLYCIYFGCTSTFLWNSSISSLNPLTEQTVSTTKYTEAT